MDQNNGIKQQKLFKNTLTKESTTFFIIGLICLVLNIVIYCQLKFFQSHNYTTLFIYRHFQIIEILLITIISSFNALKLNDYQDYKKSLILSTYYLIGYIIGELILIAIAVTFLLVTIIGILGIGIFADIIKNLPINSVLRLFYSFASIYIISNFIFGIKKIVIAIKERRFNLNILVKPFIILFLIPISFNIYNILNINLNRIITESIFYIGSKDYKKNPQIVFKNGDSLWYGNNNAEFYNFRTESTVLITKPFSITSKIISLPENNVLFAGGQTMWQGNRKTYKYAYVFDSHKYKFIKVGDLIEPLNYPETITLPNSKVLLIDSIKSQIYDIKKEKFNLTENNIFQMSTPKGIILKNNKVLIYGTHKVDKNFYKIRTQLYDITTNKFLPTKNQPISNESFTPVMLNTGKLLIIGTKVIKTEKLYENRHKRETQTTEIYDPILNKFFPLKNTLNIQRKNPDLTLLNNGLVLISGGRDLVRKIYKADKNGFVKKDHYKQFIRESELYNPQTQSFKQIESKKNQNYSTKYILFNGNILFLGGIDKTILMFDTKKNQFKILGNMRKHRSSPLIISTDKKKLIIYGGDNKVDTDQFDFERSTAEIYKPLK